MPGDDGRKSESGEHDEKKQASSKNNENEISSTSTKPSIASENPLLINLLQRPPPENAESSDSSSLDSKSDTEASNHVPDDDWVKMLKELNMYFAKIREQDKRKPVKRKLKCDSEAAENKSGSSYSAEDVHPPASKRLFHAGTVEAESSLASQTSAAVNCQSAACGSTVPTENVDSSELEAVAGSSGCSNKLSDFDSSAEAPSSAAENLISFGAQPKAESLSQRCDDVDMELEEYKKSFPASKELDYVFPIFEILLCDVHEFKEFIDAQQGVSVASATEEPIDCPSSTSQDIATRMARISEEFGTGVESLTAQTSRSVVEKVERSNLSGLVSVPHYELANQASSSEAATQENPTRATGSPKLLPEIAQMSNPLEISARLQALNVVARSTLNECIETIQSVLHKIGKKGRDKLCGEMERHINAILNVLGKMVDMRKECSILLKKGNSSSEYAKASYILKVKTHLSIIFNHILKEIVTINDLFHKNVYECHD